MLLSVLSVVLAAYAARRISRWGSGGDGWLALWFVGLLSPALFYGADFWEHAPALALALLAVALALEGGMRRVAIAGLLAGLAAVMRNDMLVAFVALGLGALLVRSERTRTLSRWRELAVGAGMLGLVLFANGVVERIVLGAPTGSSRAVQRAGVAGLAIGGRARDAVLTTFGVLANENWLALVIGGVIGIGILLMAAAAVDTSESQATGVAGAVIAWVGLTWRFVAFGVSAVPGFIPAAPVAALGLFGKRTDREQVLFLGAVIALPVIWISEWVGGHAPQWGARYLLLPTALLVVLAAGQAMRLGPCALVVALVALGAVMSFIGATWHIERTRAVTEFAHEVFDAPPETVIISDTAYWGSELAIGMATEGGSRRVDSTVERLPLTSSRSCPLRDERERPRSMCSTAATVPTRRSISTRPMPDTSTRASGRRDSSEATSSSAATWPPDQFQTVHVFAIARGTIRSGGWPTRLSCGAPESTT